jgi:hypothetical protein
MIKLRFSSLTALCRPILCSFAIGHLLARLTGYLTVLEFSNVIKNSDHQQGGCHDSED